MAKNAFNLDWQQAYVLRIRSGFEVPMDADERPDPSVWKWNDGPKKGVKDYVVVAVCGQPITRHLSPSTHTWYDTQRAAYVPSSLDIQPSKPEPKPARVAAAIRIDEPEIKAAGFSSIETFFQ